MIKRIGCNADWTVDEEAVLWEWAELMQRSPCLLAPHFQHKTCADVSARLESSPARAVKRPQSAQLPRRLPPVASSAFGPKTAQASVDAAQQLPAANSNVHAYGGGRQLAREDGGDAGVAQEAESTGTALQIDGESEATIRSRRTAGSTGAALQVTTPEGEDDGTLGARRSIAAEASQWESVASMRQSSELLTDEEGPAATSDGVVLAEGTDDPEHSTWRAKRMLRAAPKRRKRSREVVCVKCVSGCLSPCRKRKCSPVKVSVLFGRRVMC
jgi:hypothetical protein